MKIVISCSSNEIHILQSAESGRAVMHVYGTGNLIIGACVKIGQGPFFAPITF